MLSFSPGELSTIEGLHWDSFLPPFPGSGQTKVFDFADLPCPPQSVMVSLRLTLQFWHNDRLIICRKQTGTHPNPAYHTAP